MATLGDAIVASHDIVIDSDTEGSSTGRVILGKGYPSKRQGLKPVRVSTGTTDVVLYFPGHVDASWPAMQLAQ